ncbi:MAG: DUF222 domain-containing protein [Pseudolysinimonas sp.]
MTPTACDLVLVVPDVGDLAALTDDQLLSRQGQIAGARRQVDVAAATVAAEIARRSARDLGYSGLAQKRGARTPERLVAQVTGLSVPEARAMITAGEALDAGAEWMRPVTTALSAGDVSVGATAAIQTGLGEPGEHVTADELATAAQRVLDESGDLPPEQVARRAREVRDELDAAGVADRERAMRDRRFLRLIPRADGMTDVFGRLDPESAALLGDAIDLVTAPRRGGPRFVDADAKARADAIVDDPRTTDQLALDALIEMVRIAGAADEGRVFGTHKPAVRVHVAVSDLDRRRGAATIEGQTAAVSAETAARIGCAGGFLPLLFDGTEALDLGRTQRLFSARQRIVLAAIWGGCAVGGCDRPPSWTEAHHIDEWDRDHGRTDVRDGILLCRHHHMWVHDIGARIVRTGSEYDLQVPGAAPVRLRSKNPVRRAVMRADRAA